MRFVLEPHPHLTSAALASLSDAEGTAFIDLFQGKPAAITGRDENSPASRPRAFGIARNAKCANGKSIQKACRQIADRT
jgi:hypothetical protein